MPALAGATGLTAGLLVDEQGTLARLVVVALLAAVAGAAGALGPTGSAVGLQLLAMAAVADGMPLPAHWWLPGACLLAAATTVVVLGPMQGPATAAPAPTWRAAGARLLSPATALRMTRLVVAAVAAAALAAAWHPDRGYWLLLTVALVLAPDAGPVVRRAAHRALGTLVGVAAAAGLLVVHPGTALLAGAAVLAEALVPLAAAVSYGMLTTTVAPVVIALLGLCGVPLTGELLGTRVADTLAGVVIAVGVLPLVDLTARLLRNVIRTVVSSPRSA